MAAINESSSLIRNSNDADPQVSTYQPYPPLTVALNTIKNTVNPVAHLQDFAHNTTIMRAAKKQWDPARLKPKHDALAEIGAHHVTMQTKEGAKIDSVFIDIYDFLQSLRAIGFKAGVFETNIVKIDKCKAYDDDGDYLNDVLRFSFSKKTAREKIHKVLTSLYSPHGYLVQDGNNSREFYVIRKKDRKWMRDCDEVKCCADADFRKDFLIVDLRYRQKFHGFYCDFPEADVTELLETLKLSETRWCCCQTDQGQFLIETEELPQLEQAMKQHKIVKFEETKIPRSDTNPAVMLHAHQTGFYEASLHEIITFLFLGVSVFAYNNSKIGLSTGLNTETGINETSETGYRYLTEERRIPPEKILVKGVCAGFIRAAKLMQDHKNVNVWSDQAPVNFTDIALDQYKETVHNYGVHFQSKHPRLRRFAHKIFPALETSSGLQSLVKKTVPSFQADVAVHNNQGHKLITFDIPDEDGDGGDALVPTEHFMLLTDVLPNTRDKQAKLVYIPGGTHVTSWWKTDETHEKVVEFLNTTGLRNDLFSQKTTSSESIQF